MPRRQSTTDSQHRARVHVDPMASSVPRGSDRVGELRLQLNPPTPAAPVDPLTSPRGGEPADRRHDGGRAGTAGRG